MTGCACKHTCKIISFIALWASHHVYIMHCHRNVLCVFSTGLCSAKDLGSRSQVTTWKQGRAKWQAAGGGRWPGKHPLQGRGKSHFSLFLYFVIYGNIIILCVKIEIFQIECDGKKHPSFSLCSCWVIMTKWKPSRKALTVGVNVLSDPWAEAPVDG